MSYEFSAAYVSNLCELAGHSKEYPRRTLSAILKFLKHPSPVVREGAICGLENLYEGLDGEMQTQIKQQLRSLFDEEQSPGVKSCIEDALEEMK